MLNNVLYDVDGQILYVAQIPPEMIYAPREQQFLFTLKTALEDDVNLSLLTLSGVECDKEEVKKLITAYGGLSSLSKFPRMRAQP